MKKFLYILICIWTLIEVNVYSAIEYPKLNDDRLQITLYAENPDIVTPIDCATDRQGRLYVIESHTHSPPSDYEGPKGDLIKVFEGQRADGRYEKMRVFADDIFQAQALAFDPLGRLFVVCTREVIILHDSDQDGWSEDRTRILNLDPYDKPGNPHGQMQGITFSNDGWLYVATGTTSDDWISSDGARLEVGPYWGGIIARCKPDGTQLERVAWGFWNPYSMTFDRQGRLISIDNDPDHRGPNRVLHIVQGGDYGYKRHYGRYGLHPYQAWEGELPGTMPMIAGIGEAPTAILDANTASLPLDYRDTLIGASWGEHNLILYRPKEEGVSITASHEVMLQGLGHDNLTSPFRPAGLATSPVDGSIYITDWMLIDYTTHLKGRIWKVSAKPGIKTYKPRKPYSKQQPGAEFTRMQRLTESSRPADYASLRSALLEKDPFIRNAAVTAMARPPFHEKVIRDLNHKDSRIRLGALLALRRADAPNPETYIEPRLNDADLDVVQMVMIWAGEKELLSLKEAIDVASSRPGLNKSFFKIWMATMQIMEQLAIRGPTPTGVQQDSSLFNRKLSPAFIEQLIHDEKRPELLRSMAIRWLQGLETPRNHDFLAETAQTSNPFLQIEAIRRLGDSSHPEAQVILTNIALDRSQSSEMRTEALVSLSGNPDPSLSSLLNDPKSEVQLEAARTLRLLSTNPQVQNATQRKLQVIQLEEDQSRLRSQLEFLINAKSISRPSTVEDWQDLLRAGGDPDAGRRVFFSKNSICTQCHAVDGRGDKLGSGSEAAFIALPFGPDLSVIGRTANRNALIRSIVQPSDSIAPEYQGWFVRLKNGSTVPGRQIDQARKSIQVVMLDGREHDLLLNDIEAWGAMEQSLMPDGLHQTMAIEEFRDLIAFLESLK